MRNETTLEDKYGVSPNQLAQSEAAISISSKIFQTKKISPYAMTQFPNNSTWMTENLHRQINTVYIRHILTISSTAAYTY